MTVVTKPSKVMDRGTDVRERHLLDLGGDDAGEDGGGSEELHCVWWVEREGR